MIIVCFQCEIEVHSNVRYDLSHHITTVLQSFNPYTNLLTVLKVYSFSHNYNLEKCSFLYEYSYFFLFSDVKGVISGLYYIYTDSFPTIAHYNIFQL